MSVLNQQPIKLRTLITFAYETQMRTEKTSQTPTENLSIFIIIINNNNNNTNPLDSKSDSLSTHLP